MTCPHCGSRHILSNVTIRWVHLRGALLPERGHFCTGCRKPFAAPMNGDLALQAVRVTEVTPAVHSLQRSGDVVVVRYRSGAQEIVY